jgi:allophanate hydrolase subunit 1
MIVRARRRSPPAACGCELLLGPGAGSVGLADEFSGVYPRESPGGWQLIGRTEVVLWDVDRPQPALLTPGMWVRFRAVNAP